MEETALPALGHRIHFFPPRLQVGITRAVDPEPPLIPERDSQNVRELRESFLVVVSDDVVYPLQ
eukprot:3698818-Rhodomonas_salina.2